MKHIIITIKPKEKLIMPFAHFEAMQGLVYKLMSFDRGLSTAVHDKKEGAQAAIKLFTFSDLIGRYTIESGKRVYAGEFDFEIRAADDILIDTIEDRLKKDPRLNIRGYSCEAVGFETGSCGFTTGAMVFKMNTPITVYRTEEDGFIHYFTPDEPEFAELVANNLKRKYREVFGREYEGELHFDCLWKNEKSMTVTKFKGHSIAGWRGNYLLGADADMIKTAYYCGIGGKNSQGFGFAMIGE